MCFFWPHKNEITKNTMTITGTKNRFISRFTNSPKEDCSVSINHRRLPTLCTESSNAVNTNVAQHNPLERMLLPSALESTQMVKPTTPAVVESVRKLSSGWYLSGTFGSAWWGLAHARMDLACCLGSGRAQHDLRKSPHPVVSVPPCPDEEQMAQENNPIFNEETAH